MSQPAPPPAQGKLRVNVAVERDATGVPAVRIEANVAGMLVCSFAVPPMTAKAIARLVDEKADEAGTMLHLAPGSTPNGDGS